MTTHAQSGRDRVLAVLAAQDKPLSVACLFDKIGRAHPQAIVAGIVHELYRMDLVQWDHATHGGGWVITNEGIRAAQQIGAGE